MELEKIIAERLTTDVFFHRVCETVTIVCLVPFEKLLFLSPGKESEVLEARLLSIKVNVN